MEWMGTMLFDENQALKARTRMRVVHVDDDPSILRLVAKRLGDQGIEVISVEDPREVLSLVTNDGIRVVIVDVDLPYIDGVSLLQNIKASDAGVQVILCTGMVSLITITSAIAAGAEGCVFKPLTDITPLVTAVNHAFAKIDRWWDVLSEWTEIKTRNRSEGRIAEAFDSTTGLPFVPSNRTINDQMAPSNVSR